MQGILITACLTVTLLMIIIKRFCTPVLLMMCFTALHSQDISIEALGLKVPRLHNCTAVKDQSNSSTC